ncbi:hypothetical protein [Flectobacillus major]|uniref:hypothetical protein n=1 Tax=Flectobacillus major TaxID=103 RepID=UPI0003FA75CF|nr:hypothetical protein [Flectobacillus major]
MLVSITFISQIVSVIGITPNEQGFAMLGHLKNVSPTFAQMPNRSTNVEFTTVSPTIANTMLAVVFLSMYIA